MNEKEKRALAADICDEAIDLESDSDREAHIATRCAGDPELASYVRGYLVDSGGGPNGPFFERYIGKQLGQWTIKRFLGSGGFGFVFVAERNDPELSAALKLLQGTIHSRDSEARFHQEQKVLAKLSHPYIAHFLDAGVTPEGQRYLVMEYIDGAQPIDDYCRDHKLTTHQKIELFQKICEAVSYAHKNLVVHRDLKPDNILIATDGTPKLVDFNLAKLLGPPDEYGEKSKTRAGMGTDRYMSPEQARGEDVNTTTDVYSLGCVLYELLTGTDPYDLDRRVNDAVDKIICEVTPQAASQAVRRSFVRKGDMAAQMPASRSRELSGDIDTILQVALRKEPERRYQSVDQLKEDLLLHLQIKPVRARADSFLYRASRFGRRNKTTFQIALSGLLAPAALLACLYVAMQLSSYSFSGAWSDENEQNISIIESGKSITVQYHGSFSPQYGYIQGRAHTGQRLSRNEIWVDYGFLYRKGRCCSGTLKHPLLLFLHLAPDEIEWRNRTSWQRDQRPSVH